MIDCILTKNGRCPYDDQLCYTIGECGHRGGTTGVREPRNPKPLGGLHHAVFDLAPAGDVFPEELEAVGGVRLAFR